MFSQKDVVPVCKACNKICRYVQPSGYSAKAIAATLFAGFGGMYAATNPYYQCPICHKKYHDLRKAVRKNQIVFRKFTPNIPTYDPNENLNGVCQESQTHEALKSAAPTHRSLSDLEIAKVAQLFVNGYREAVSRRDSKRAQPANFDGRPEAYRIGYMNGFAYGTKQFLLADCQKALDKFIRERENN